MKKLLISLFAIMLIAGCGGKQTKLPLVDAAMFDAEQDGRQIALYTLRGGDLTLQVTNFGGRVVSLFVPDRDGNYADVELGYSNLIDYIDNPGERFLGACVGPVANRIGGASFTLDNKRYQLEPNDNDVNTLHGGFKGLDLVVWDVAKHDSNKIVMHYLKTDGEGGFPGNVSIYMTYELTDDNEFKVSYSATTDAPTVFNITHHSFFNLKGEAGGTILDNEMVINASAITPTDSLLIPTGEILPVEGTVFDFRTPHLIGERIAADDINLIYAGGYDHNWVLDRKSENDIEFACSVYESVSGRYMEVYTDQPGLQFYSGNFFKGINNGKYNLPLKYREALALETQKFPDGPNQPTFPSVRLNPGEHYTHNCVYKFSTR